MANVNILCKLPQGLKITHAGKTVTLVGANKSGNRFGFGVTKDVDGDWFKDWLDKGHGSTFPAVKNGSIFAMTGTPDKAADAAAERRKDAKVQTGLEPLDPENPGEGVEPTDEQKKETAKALSQAEPADVK